MNINDPSFQELPSGAQLSVFINSKARDQISKKASGLNHSQDDYINSYDDDAVGMFQGSSEMDSSVTKETRNLTEADMVPTVESGQTFKWLMKLEHQKQNPDSDQETIVEYLLDTSKFPFADYGGEYYKMCVNGTVLNYDWKKFSDIVTNLVSCYKYHLMKVFKNGIQKHLCNHFASGVCDKLPNILKRYSELKFQYKNVPLDQLPNHLKITKTTFKAVDAVALVSDRLSNQLKCCPKVTIPKRKPYISTSNGVRSGNIPPKGCGSKKCIKKCSCKQTSTLSESVIESTPKFPQSKPEGICVDESEDENVGIYNGLSKSPGEQSFVGDSGEEDLLQDENVVIADNVEKSIDGVDWNVPARHDELNFFNSLVSVGDDVMVKEVSRILKPISNNHQQRQLHHLDVQQQNQPSKLSKKEEGTTESQHELDRIFEQQQLDQDQQELQQNQTTRRRGRPPNKNKKPLEKPTQKNQANRRSGRSRDKKEEKLTTTIEKIETSEKSTSGNKRLRGN